MQYPTRLQNQPLPGFSLVKRRFADDAIADLKSAISLQLDRILPAAGIRPGDTVAVAVGSRGIDRLPEIVAEVCRCIRKRGATAWIAPAMGSHGGANAEGQLALLRRLGVTQSRCGTALRASMEVEQVGAVFGEVPLYFGQDFLSADHCICINRIKPHTKFKGSLESGICKMLAVGMGKHAGAQAYHRWAFKYGFGPLLEAMGTTLAQTTPFRIGLALVENERHGIVRIQALTPGDLVEGEKRLLELAKQRFARLPLDRLDVLVIEQIGKEISGAGMDPNVTGRAADLMESDFSAGMNASRVAVLGLSAASDGNALGMGNADVITQRLFDKLDYDKMVTNALTSLSLHKAFVPIRLPDDRSAIQACFATLGPIAADRVRAAIIRDTNTLSVFLASEGLLPELQKINGLTIEGLTPLKFDKKGNLILEQLAAQVDPQFHLDG